MNWMISMVKIMYNKNKLLAVLVAIALLVFIAGCSTQGSGYAPSGPVGGGCGG